MGAAGVAIDHHPPGFQAGHDVVAVFGGGQFRGDDQGLQGPGDGRQGVSRQPPHRRQQQDPPALIGDFQGRSRVRAQFDILQGHTAHCGRRPVPLQGLGVAPRSPR